MSGTRAGLVRRIGMHRAPEYLRSLQPKSDSFAQRRRHGGGAAGTYSSASSLAHSTHPRRRRAQEAARELGDAQQRDRGQSRGRGSSSGPSCARRTGTRPSAGSPRRTPPMPRSLRSRSRACPCATDTIPSRGRHRCCAISGVLPPLDGDGVELVRVYDGLLTRSRSSPNHFCSDSDSDKFTQFSLTSMSIYVCIYFETYNIIMAVDRSIQLSSPRSGYN